MATRCDLEDSDDDHGDGGDGGKDNMDEMDRGSDSDENEWKIGYVDSDDDSTGRER